MNLKTFAQKSRQILMDGVAKKMLYWGFDPDGKVLETPQKISGGYSFRGEVKDDPNVPKLWEALHQAIQQKGINNVVEEAAYTWFNRIMAFRIMAKNGYEQSLLENVEGLDHTPVLLQRARQGNYSFLKKQEQERLKRIIGDYNKDQEAFALLLVGYCQSNTTLNNLFGKIDDYTELLLPDNMLQDSGFLHLLNTTDAISEEDYKEVELIGWLYQFYISELKDNVFALFDKGKKAEAEDIPAATQIFTPNWIVKYMVENTVGQHWLDKNPESPLRDKMKYLVESSDSLISNPTSLISSLEELTLLDPAVGSGHILVEGFDLLYEMYMEEYYTPEEAVESIFKKNLFGLDIDERAVQLANFAVLLKAAKKYRDVFSKGWLPNIYAMPEKRAFSRDELAIFLGEEGKDFVDELVTTLELMQQAKNLGSTMKLSLTKEARAYILQRFEELSEEEFLNIDLQSIFQDLESFISVLKVLTRQYMAVVANPPYMKNSNMNLELKNYVDQNYPSAKYDLGNVFILVLSNLSVEESYFSFINQEAWMYKKSYKSLRKKILDFQIVSLLHLGPGTFKELPGEVVQNVSTSIKKSKSKALGTFIDLTKYDYEEKRNNFFQERKFKTFPQKFLENDNYEFTYKLNLDLKNSYRLQSRIGVQPRSENIYLWWSVDYKNINYVPYNKGGSYRKWYGNNNWFLRYGKNGSFLIKKNIGLTNKPFYFQEHISWTRVSSKLNLRYYSKQFIWDNTSPAIFEDIYGALGLLNSNVGDFIRRLKFRGTKIESGHINSIDCLGIKNSKIITLVKSNVELSKKDWDSRETSWDFEQSPLLNQSANLEEAYALWEKDVTKDFFQLHANEEELDRIFIDIYGLQEELTPDVALKDITILQEELSGRDLEALEEDFRNNGAEAINLPIDKKEVISQLISYAVGVFMGRYRLDKPGLHIAHPNPTAEEIEEYRVISGEGLGGREQELIFSHIRNEYPEFSRSIGLAALNEPGDKNLSDFPTVSEGRTIRSEQSDSKSSSFSSEQHSRGTTADDEGVYSISENRQGLSVGDRNTTGNRTQSQLSEEIGITEYASGNNGNTKDVEWLDEQAKKLIANHSSLPTTHSSLTTIEIDEDGILPVMGRNSNFPDDVLQQIHHFLDAVWGHETRTENLNFIQDCLNKDLEEFLVKDFYDYHCKKYKKKPIYWLFSSSRGAFQVLVYMHRMNPFTVEKIRSNYLLEHIKNLRSREAVLAKSGGSLSSQESKRLEQIRRDIAECEAYDMELKEVADAQIPIDLDDGVDVNYPKFGTVVAKIR